MKAIYITQPGGPEVLQLVERPNLQAGDGQLLIEVHASGVNFADLITRQGTYPLVPKPPMTPGLEVAGHVVGIGANVDDFAVGDRVMVLKRGENVGDRYVKNTDEHEVLEIIVSGTRETALTADGALARAA